MFLGMPRHSQSVSFHPGALIITVLLNLMLGVTLRWTSTPSRRVETLLVASCNRNWDKLQSDGRLSSYAGFIFYLTRAIGSSSEEQKTISQ